MKKTGSLKAERGAFAPTYLLGSHSGYPRFQSSAKSSPDSHNWDVRNSIVNELSYWLKRLRNCKESALPVVVSHQFHAARDTILTSVFTAIYCIRAACCIRSFRSLPHCRYGVLEHEPRIVVIEQRRFRYSFLFLFDCVHVVFLRHLL